MTTTTGLNVHAELDTTPYPRGIRISNNDIATLEAGQLHRHTFHGDWNYTLNPQTSPTRPQQPT